MLQADQGFAQFLREFAVRGKVDFMLLQDEFVDKGLQKIVNVIAAKMGIAVGAMIDIAVTLEMSFQNEMSDVPQPRS